MGNDLRTLLIHPDPEVRHALREFLEGAEGVRIVGEAVCAAEALELLDMVPYSVFFLGTELGSGMDGFELARVLGQRKAKPSLVFVAATETLAFQALEHGALDYLLWPFNTERFARTLEKLRHLRAAFKASQPVDAWKSTVEDAAEGDEEREQTLRIALGEEDEEKFLKALRQAWDFSRMRPVEIEKLAVSIDGRVILIPYDQIVFIEADEDYSYVHVAGQKFLTSYRIKDLEDRLRPHRFFRVHRKYLVNLDLVTEIASLPGSNFMLRTTGKTRIELPISRRRIADLKQMLGL